MSCLADISLGHHQQTFAQKLDLMRPAVQAMDLPVQAKAAHFLDVVLDMVCKVSPSRLAFFFFCLFLAGVLGRGAWEQKNHQQKWGGATGPGL